MGAERKEEHFMLVVHHYQCPRAAKSEECGMHFKARVVHSLCQFFIACLCLVWIGWSRVERAYRG